jgi:esterase/lipase
MNTHLSNSERLFRSIRLMARTMRPRRDQLILPEEHRTTKGVEYHVYYPSGKAIRTVLLVYGMTITGENDPRLLKFARACTDVGLKVVIPHLPGLMDFRVKKNDYDRLLDVAGSIAASASQKIGIIGFSTGGSYSLLVGAHSHLHKKIGPIVLFSPIYEIDQVAERLHTPPDPAPETDEEWDQFYWAQFVIAFRNMHRLRLSIDIRAGLGNLLEDYSFYSLDSKRGFYNAHVRPLNLPGRGDLLNEGSVQQMLSARGKLGKVQSPVFILHDADDWIVPPDHSKGIYDELRQRGPGYTQELLVTPWLSHVVLRNTGNPGELVKIVRFVAELFRQ